MAKAEAAVEQKDTPPAGLKERILAARKSPPVPSHTRGELEALGAQHGLVARIARGLLRIGFVLDSAPLRHIPVIDPATVLPEMAGYLYADPLAFALFAFDFGHDPSLRVVKMPAGYEDRFDSEYGIEQWACEFFDEVAGQVKVRAFDGSTPVDAIRHALSSGHGISKSATSAMLINWLMTTRPNARGIVTANTAPQLESKTFAELSKWHKRSVFSEWFDVTTGRGSMKMVAREAPESWNVFGQTAAEERSESFAGLHAADSTPFYVFDEASAIPGKIWEVAEGAMTDGEPHFYALGNPTRNTGKFFECFNGQRHRWTCRQIDSRNVSLTNKTQLNEWTADFGEDSDFCKVRVRGVFPSASSLQFIPRQLVDDAVARESGRIAYDQAVVVGVDPARFGDDASVIFTRHGRDGRTFEPIRLRGVDTMNLASRVGEHVNLLRSAGWYVVINIDGGGVGGGVVDRLRSLNYDVNEVAFGGRATDQKKFANKRAEIWSEMRAWLAGGTLAKDEGLATDLCSVEYGFNSNDQILLERKESMKARGLASPDTADALAITFAVPVPLVEDGTGPRWQQAVRTESPCLDYDPLSLEANKGHDPLSLF